MLVSAILPYLITADAFNALQHIKKAEGGSCLPIWAVWVSHMSGYDSGINQLQNAHNAQPTGHNYSETHCIFMWFIHIHQYHNNELLLVWDSTPSILYSSSFQFHKIMDVREHHPIRRWSLQWLINTSQMTNHHHRHPNAYSSTIILVSYSQNITIGSF